MQKFKTFFFGFQSKRSPQPGTSKLSPSLPENESTAIYQSSPQPGTSKLSPSLPENESTAIYQSKLLSFDSRIFRCQGCQYPFKRSEEFDKDVVIYRFETHMVWIKGKRRPVTRNYYYHVSKSCITDKENGNPSAQFPLRIKMDRRVDVTKHLQFIQDMEKMEFKFHNWLRLGDFSKILCFIVMVIW